MKFHPVYKIIICSALIWLFLFSTPAVITAAVNAREKTMALTEYTVSVSTTQATTGTEITVNWEAPAGHAANDFIRLAKVSDPDGIYNWSQNIGSSNTGSFNVTVPDTVARYEFRVFRGSDGVRMAQSSAFIANKPNYSITTNVTTIPAGGQLTVDWTSPENRPATDRLAISAVNNSAVITQQYTNGVSPKTVQMTAPAQTGQFEIRYLESGSSQVLALSEIITVEAAAGYFAGQIRDGGTGNYFGNALVEVLQSNVVKGTALTNTNGSYNIPLSLAGTYDIKVTAAGYPVQTQSGKTVTSGNTTIVDFALYNTGSISGKITKTSSSVPINGASIKIKQGATLIASGSSDFAGNYNFPALPPGTYSAEVTANGFSVLTQSNITVAAGNPTVLNLNMTAISGGTGGLEYLYDAAGRVVAVKAQGIVQNIYNYDPSGNLLSIVTPQGNNPYIISFTPTRGTVGSQVIISGINFSETNGQNTVSFNGTAAIISSFSATEIVTTVPAGASTGTISVSTPNGTAVTGQSFVVESSTDGNAPTIGGFTPIVGHPGDSVTITGTNFETEVSDNSVLFGASGANVSSASPTSLTVSANNSSGKISVTTPNGTAVSSGDFYSIPVPIDTTKVRFAERTWFGNHKWVNIPAGDNIGAVIFDGIQGKRFSIQLFNLSKNVKIEIYRPDGRLLTSHGFNSQYDPNSWFVDTQTIPLTGAYTILISALTAIETQTQLSMKVYDVPPDITGEMEFNSVRTISFGTPGQNGLLTYNAIAGQKILVGVKDSTHEGQVTVTKFINVYNPGPPVTITATAYFITPITTPDGTTIPETGTYSIFLDPKGTSTGPMTVSLYLVPPDPTYPINIGSSETVTTTAAGQNAWLEFSGTAGQRISLQTRNVTFSGGFQISLNKPNGTFFLTPRKVYSGSFIDTMILPETGVYKIYVNPDGEYFGSATIDLFNVPPDIVASTTISGSPVTVTSTIPGHNPSVSFAGVQGGQARLNVTGTNFPNNTALRIKKPDGTVLSSGSIANGSGYISSATLTETGTFTAEVDPSGAATGYATLAVGGDVAGTVTPGGSNTTVDINNVGQSAWLSFSGTAGQKISLKLTNVTISSGTASFRNTDGSLLGNLVTIGPGYPNFLDTVTLPANGTYKVMIDPADTNTGTATLTLYNVPADDAGTITIGGSAQTKTTTVPGQNLSVSFSGTASQKFSLELTGVSIAETSQIQIKKPDGNTLVSTTTTTSGSVLNDVVIPESGSYKVFINPVNANTGSITLQLISTGTGSNPTLQLYQSVAVLRGSVIGPDNQLSSSVSVLKGTIAGEGTASSATHAVSVSTGPVIGSLSPLQAAKATTVTLTINGNNLNGVNAIRFYNSSGVLDTTISISNITVSTDGTGLTATMQISSGAALGERFVIVSTNGSGQSQKENVTVNKLTITQN